MDEAQAKALIRKTFENEFNEERFNRFISELLNTMELARFDYFGAYIPDPYKDHICRYKRIGKYNDGKNRIDVLITYLKKQTLIERARSRQRNFVAGFLKGEYGSSSRKNAALVAFVPPDEEDWRFSLVKVDYIIENGEVIEKKSPARRWSFLVGKNEASHTAQSRLIHILEDDEHNPTLAQLEEAFNIESVTKEFFEGYRDLLIRTVNELDKIVESDEKVKSNFESRNINTVDFAKKLLEQIVFLYFLQKKGWFGVDRDDRWSTGPKNFLRRLFDKKYGNYENFFNDILEPLFYEALAHQRDEDFYSRFNCKIPFLSGLFEPIGEYDWVHTDILLPDDLFSNSHRTPEGDIGDGILDVFDRFNFTVKEDEPLEKEVAIDPELLGKLYEKFNAIRPDNFGEYKKALKSKKSLEERKFNKKFGVYYTPREIVHYMCQESLINHLSTELEGKCTREDIEDFIKHGEQYIENDGTALIKEQRIKEGKQKTSNYGPKLPESIRENAKLIDEKLRDIKVCDPAVGSGAFLVGMMHEIVNARNVLSVHVKEPERTSYNFKWECIENSLYGVDVDAGACEVAKLRLWLSLIVDEEDVTKIKPLPNLDYKIVQGDSLLGVGEWIFNWKSFKRFRELKALYFNETNHKKKRRLKHQIDELISEITNGRKDFDFNIYFSEVFHEKGGFDVVIANPPYVGEKGHKEMFREIRQGILSKFYQGKMDLFYFFFHLALNIGRHKAHIAFITTNYYPTATGARKLRQDFKERAIFKKLINFNELKIFEGLGEHNMITILQKDNEQNAIAETCITERQGDASLEVLHKIFDGTDDKTKYYKISQNDIYDGEEYYIRLMGSSEISNTPVQVILDKIKIQGVNLGDICNVNQGIVTGADRVSQKHINKYSINAKVGDGIFVLSDKEVEELKLTVEEKNLLKPWFKNSNILRYYTRNKTEEYVIYLDGGYREEDVPNIIHHLVRFKANLQERREVHKGTRNWYDLWWSRKQTIFESPKIVAPQRSPRNTFGYNEIPWYASADVYFITQKDNLVSLKYILALLNSKLYYL